jgi:RNA polymerase subunit RPABC4/transcription elongation factor Spt4
MTDFFENLGGFKKRIKGLSDILTRGKTRDELGKITVELDGFKRREREIYAEIGRQVYELEPDKWDADGKLKLVRSGIAEYEDKFKRLVTERENARRTKTAGEKTNACHACGFDNPGEMKFCQNCGAKLTDKPVCQSCGKEITPDIRFCGFCGARTPKNEFSDMDAAARDKA